MKLYYSPGACSFSPHIALREIGIDFELVKVDIKSGKVVADGSDFKSINPKGYVPFLQLDDGRTLSEGPAIVQYIADLKPEAGLAPRADSFERYRLQEWLGFINSEIHKNFGPLFNASSSEDQKNNARANLTKRLNFVADHAPLRRNVTIATRKVTAQRIMPAAICSFHDGKLLTGTPGGYFTVRWNASNNPQ